MAIETRLLILLRCLCTVFVLTSLQHRGSKVFAESNISITPIPKAPASENQYIGFKLTASWMDGYIRVRFPEDVNSSLGRHFLDNVAPELERVSNVEVPDWHIDQETGRISYEVRTEEGIHFGGLAYVEGNTVHMQFRVLNQTGQPQDLSNQVCLDMSPTKDFNRRNTIESTFACFDHDHGAFDKLTCSHGQEKYHKTGYHWILMLHGKGPHYETELEEECPWWIVDQKADLPLIWRESQDRDHLVAITWEGDTVRRLMTNTNIPCLHSDPLAHAKLLNGKEGVWRGRIILMENDVEKLLSEYEKGGSQKGSPAEETP